MKKTWIICLIALYLFFFLIWVDDKFDKIEYEIQRSTMYISDTLDTYNEQKEGDRMRVGTILLEIVYTLLAVIKTCIEDGMEELEEKITERNERGIQ